MRSDAGINALRANGRKSRGPATPEGKEVSSRNRISHGLFIDSSLLPGEDKKELRKVLAREFLGHEPESRIENQIFQKLALYQWKQMRIWAMQVGGRAGELRHRYEVSYLRPYRFLKREPIALRARQNESIA